MSPSPPWRTVFVLEPAVRAVRVEHVSFDPNPRVCFESARGFNLLKDGAVLSKVVRLVSKCEPVHLHLHPYAAVDDYQR